MQTKTNLARVNGIERGYQEFGQGKPLAAACEMPTGIAPALSAAVIPFLDGA